MYSTWQLFDQDLLVDSPLLLYIDVQHANFLLPSLTIGEARDLNPRYTTAEDLTLVKDESAEQVSQSRKAHIPVKELAMVESINFLEAEFDLGEDEMVTRRGVDHWPFHARCSASLTTARTRGIET